MHNADVETLLLQAATNSELSDPFVQILELGNYAITYKVSGMLTEVKSLLTARSSLRRQVVNVLHDAGVEIMSPSFMNQRKIADDGKVVPAQRATRSSTPETVAEDVVFDKAEKAEQREDSKDQLLIKIAACEETLKTIDKEHKGQIQNQLKMLQDQLKVVDQTISE